MWEGTRQVKTLLVVSGPTSTPVEGGGTIRRTVVQLRDGAGYVLLADAQHGSRPFVTDETLVFKCDVEGHVQSFTEIWGMRETRTEEVLSLFEKGVTVWW